MTTTTRKERSYDKQEGQAVRRITEALDDDDTIKHLIQGARLTLTASQWVAGLEPQSLC